MGRKRKQTPRLPMSTLWVQNSDSVEIFWKLKLYYIEFFIQVSEYSWLLDRLQTKCSGKITPSLFFLR